MGSDQLDPAVQTFTKAIAMQEGGGKLLPYTNPSGDEPNDPPGTAGGRYQFTAPTWRNYAQEVLGSADAPMTPENQNKVAYTKFKQWHDQGHTFAEMASMWNAGQGAPEAYKDPNFAGGRVGQYVKNVQKYAQQFESGQGGVPGYTPPSPTQDSGQNVPGYAAPTPPSSDAQGQGMSDTSAPPPQQDAMKSLLGNTAGSVADFAFPILSDIGADLNSHSTKSALQQLGDLGLSAMWFVPGVGDLAEGAIRGTGLLSDVAAKYAGHALGGASQGYLADVSSKLSQGQTDAGSVLTPGLGTATGGFLGGIAPKVSSLLTGKVLPALSERPAAAFQQAVEKPGAVKAAIKDAGNTPETVLKNIQGGIRGLRKTLSQAWESGVNTIQNKYSNVQVGLNDSMTKKAQTLSDEFGIELPKNIRSMTARELIDLYKQVNELPNKLLTTSPKGAMLRAFKSNLKDLAVKTFGGVGGDLDNFYKDYATRKGVFDAADSLFSAYKLNKPKSQQTALGIVTSLFNGNKSEYLKALQALEQATGQDFTSTAAGLQFKKILPPINLAHKSSLGQIIELLKAPFSSPRGAAWMARGGQTPVPGLTAGGLLRGGLIRGLTGASQAISQNQAQPQ